MSGTGPATDIDPVSEDRATAPALVREHRPRISEQVRQTWHYRSLILRLGLRQVVKGYVGTRLGRPWLVIRPLVSIFGMALIFGSVLQAPSNGVPYLLFLLVGTLGWIVIERTVFWATRSLDIYRKVVGRLPVPVMLAPTAALGPMLIDATIIAAITVGVATYYTVTEGALAVQLGPELLLAAAGIALGVTLAYGLGLWLATLNGLARDVRITLRFVLPIWMYVTPVLYPTDALPERWRFLATINPAAAPVELVKQGVLGVSSVETSQLVVSLCATVTILASGLWFMTRLSPTLLRTAPYIDDEEEEEGRL
jgi:lipopolysaccharide transport system permease protein